MSLPIILVLRRYSLAKSPSWAKLAKTFQKILVTRMDLKRWVETDMWMKALMKGISRGMLRGRFFTLTRDS